MKRLLVLLLSIFLASCSTLGLKDIREIFVVHIRGDWCKTCDVTDPVLNETKDYFKNRKNVEYIVFDETNAETIAKSAQLAAKLGLSDLFEHERHTGEVLYVDKKTKKVLTRFYGVDSKRKYIYATERLLAGQEVESITANRRNYNLSKPNLKTIKKAKLLVVDIHHDMCGGCAVTAPVFEEVAKDYVKNKKICFLTFDLTTPQTVDETRKLAQELGLEEIYNNHKHTGEVLFINARKKRVDASLVLEKDKNRYHELIEDLT